MRKTFAPLDDVLIERLFQPAADLLACRTGQSRGAAACFCLDLASLAWIASHTPALSSAVTARDVSTATFDVSLLLLGLVALTSLRTLFRRVTGKPGNPLRLAMLPHRATVLLMLTAGLVKLRGPGMADVADIAMLVCATTALYLVACVERPPSRRRAAGLASAR